MSDSYIRTGYVRTGYSMMYHEIFDLYHPYIGDQATLYYLFLLRSRNNEPGHPDAGKSWRGRKGVVQKFKIAYKTLPTIDAILQAAGLIEIELRPCGRGREKIVYVVNDPLERALFREREPEIIARLKRVIKNRPEAKSLIGKEKRDVLLSEERYNPPHGKI